MTPAAYISTLIRPDLATFREVRQRGWWDRTFAWRRDARLQALFLCVPVPVSDREGFAEACLEWVYDYITPVYQGTHDAPQSAARTLDTLSGDCEDGAILLACMLVSALDPAAWPLFRFCVGTVAGQPQHAVLELDRRDLGETVLLDWTLSPQPMCHAAINWTVDSAVPLSA